MSQTEINPGQGGGGGGKCCSGEEWMVGRGEGGGEGGGKAAFAISKSKSDG